MGAQRGRPAVLVTAERDGDTVSPERGVYLVSLDARGHGGRGAGAPRRQPRRRTGAASEGRGDVPPDRRRREARRSPTCRPRESTATRRRSSTSTRSTSPGPATGRRASTCSRRTARSGTSPSTSGSSRAGALGGKTANVIATLRGTENPELVYVVSSHYDSNASGPGADDDSSATAALLEAARVLAKRPMPATIVFASFTGEESGLLGSREFVRRAQAGEEAHRRCAEQRHDRLGQRPPPRQHDPVLERGHPRRAARAPSFSHETHHLRRPVLQVDRRGGLLRGVRRHRRRDRLVPRAGQPALPPAAPTCSRR